MDGISIPTATAGEALLAPARTAGRRAPIPGEVDVGEVGPWRDTGFHVVDPSCGAATTFDVAAMNGDAAVNAFEA